MRMIRMSYANTHELAIRITCLAGRQVCIAIRVIRIVLRDGLSEAFERKDERGTTKWNAVFL